MTKIITIIGAASNLVAHSIVIGTSRWNGRSYFGLVSILLRYLSCQIRGKYNTPLTRVRQLLTSIGERSKVIAHSIVISTSRCSGHSDALISFSSSSIPCVVVKWCVEHTVDTCKSFSYSAWGTMIYASAYDFHRYIALERTFMFVDKFKFLFSIFFEVQESVSITPLCRVRIVIYTNGAPSYLVAHSRLIGT